MSPVYQQLATTFAALDIHRSGYLDQRQFNSLCRRLFGARVGTEITEQEMDEQMATIWSQIDIDGDDRITLAELVSAMSDTFAGGTGGSPDPALTPSPRTSPLPPPNLGLVGTPTRSGGRSRSNSASPLPPPPPLALSSGSGVVMPPKLRPVAMGTSKSVTDTKMAPSASTGAVGKTVPTAGPPTPSKSSQPQQVDASYPKYSPASDGKVVDEKQLHEELKQQFAWLVS